jgi:hypothetical protein
MEKLSFKHSEEIKKAVKAGSFLKLMRLEKIMQLG